jgi:hypothetical protein
VSEGFAQQKRWELKLSEVDALRDRLGKSVDRGIRETVAILQLIGLHTWQSCEGHLDWGLPAPWVRLYVPETEKLREEIIPLNDWLEEHDEDTVEYDQILQKLNRLREQEGRYEAHAWTILFSFLETFYRQYPTVSYEHQIVLHLNGRLTIQGLLLQGARDTATQALKLHEYQEEMRRFTQYLTEQFLRHSFYRLSENVSCAIMRLWPQAFHSIAP